MVKGLANLIEFLILLPIFDLKVPKIFQLVLIVETLLSKLSNLNLIALSIEQLPFSFLELNPEQFNFIRKSLDFDSLEDNNEADVIPKVGFLVVREILDA